MHSRRNFISSAGAGVLSGVLGGCSKESRRQNSLVLLRGNGPEPDSLDPHRATTTEAQSVLRDLYEPLTRISPAGAPSPGAAENWTTSADGRSYVFLLRPELKWSDGSAVTADDFVAGFRRLVDPATASPYAQLIEAIAGASDVITGKMSPINLGVSADGKRTVKIDLVSPTPYLPALLAHASTAPLHRPSFEKHREGFTRPGAAVSNGAFKLTDWQSNLHVLISRNPHYWNRRRVSLDAVKYFHIADENAELRAYRAGELHITQTIPRGQFDWVRENLGNELHIAPILNTYFYSWNFDRPLFRDVRVRRLLSLVVDRELLARAVLRVGELPAYGWVPPGIPAYTNSNFDYARTSMAERIAEAKSLYADAGFSPAKPLRFTLTYNAGEVHTKLAIAVSSMWKEALGIEATLAGVELRTMLSDIERRNFDMFRLGWLADYADPVAHLQFLKSNFGVNMPHFRNSAYDELLERASTASSIDRFNLLSKAEQLLLDEHAVLPLYHYVNKKLVRSVVKGWYNNPSSICYSADLALSGPLEAA